MKSPRFLSEVSLNEIFSYCSLLKVRGGCVLKKDLRFGSCGGAHDEKSDEGKVLWSLAVKSARVCEAWRYSIEAIMRVI